MYESPIEIIYKNMQTKVENNVFAAVQEYGISVDKEELIKALQYDRDQYERGYRDGLLHRADVWISVEERLPDGNGRFLTVDGKGDMMVCYWEKHFGWFASVCNKNAITHWMPMPEPPEPPKP